MVPVMLEVPAAGYTRQRAKIEVPQMSHFRFHERFRWPMDQVLLIGLGMVAPPLPVDKATLAAALPLPDFAGPGRPVGDDREQGPRAGGPRPVLGPARERGPIGIGIEASSLALVPCPMLKGFRVQGSGSRVQKSSNRNP